MIPTHQAAAGVALFNRSGLILMVDTVRRGPDRLVLPGGVVEKDESPATAAEREVLEETGLPIVVSRLLAVAHQGPPQFRLSGLRFVFDTATVADNVVLVPQFEEVNELLWLEPAEAIARHAKPGDSMLALALAARESSQCPAYLDSERHLEPGFGKHPR